MSAALRWNARLGQLTIPESLLEALGWPLSLVAQREDDGVIVLYRPGDPRIRPDSKARKVSRQARAMARLSIGPDPARFLGLRDGWWNAEVQGAALILTFGHS